MYQTLIALHLCISKYLQSFIMWCWTRLEEISWTDSMKNEVLHRVNEERNILHTLKRRKVKWFGHISYRNWLLKHTIEGTVEGGIEVTRRREGRCKQLMDSLSETRGYCKLKEEALGGTAWRSRFARRYGPAVRHATE